MKFILKYLIKSPLFNKSRQLLEYNSKNWNYPLTKWQKLHVGAYMILSDYITSKFPPKYTSEEKTYDAEISYHKSILKLGTTEQQISDYCMRKPFVFDDHTSPSHFKNFYDIFCFFQKLDIRPPSSLLEAGCGSGWLSEFFATLGFHVTATSIDGFDKNYIDLRQKTLEIKKLNTFLRFEEAPMEYLNERLKSYTPFDIVLVYEALHHAYDWKKTLYSFYNSLEDGGWCFIINEPNLIHTFVSYRIGKLSNTHEIGLNPNEIRKELYKLGFKKVIFLKNRFHFWSRSIWIAAQK